MTSAERRAQDQPRDTAEWLYICYADEHYFVPSYDDVPVDLKNELETNGGLPCDGGGVPGPWCRHSRFGDAQAA